jgi:hypothetical protein
MRKILIILSFLIPVFVFSQNEQYIGTPQNIVKARGGLMSDSSYYLPLRDTNFIPVRNGAMICRLADGLIYKYVGHWIVVGGGSSNFGYVEKTATYNVSATDYVINCTSGTFTVTLPTAIGITGKPFVIKNTGTGVITIATSLGQTIDGAATVPLGVQNQSINLISTGANYIIN